MKTDILSLSETMLDSSVSEAEIYIPGYRFVRLDRNRNGGRILTYIKENTPFNVKRDLFIDGLELMCVEVYLAKHKQFVIVYWYRPPDSNINMKFNYINCRQCVFKLIRKLFYRSFVLSFFILFIIIL